MKRKHSLSLLLFIAAFFTVFFANGQSNQLNITDFPHDRSTQLEQFYRNDDEHDNTKNSRHFKGLNNQLDNPNKTVKNNFLKSGNNKQVPVEYYDIYWDSAFIIYFYALNQTANLRKEITRDASGNLLSEIFQYYDSSSKIWVHSSKYSYTYNDSDNKLTELFQYWFADNLIDSWKFSYTYDSTGNMLSKLYESWFDQSHNLISANLNTFSYDTSGNLLSELVQNYDKYNNIWINSFQKIYTYDESGNRISYLEESWIEEANKWSIYYKYVSNYNIYGYKISGMTLNYDNQNNLWEVESQDTSIYDDSGCELSRIIQNWDNENNNWVNRWKSYYTYDAACNVLSETFQKWETDKYIWENSSKKTYAYDEYGNMLLKLNQFWESDYNAWINYDKYEWQHDFEAKKSSGRYFGWNNQDEEWWPATASSLSIYLFGNRLYYFSTVWGGIHSAEIYYSVYSNDKENGVSDDDNSLIIYPNPAGKTVNIKFTTSSPESGDISIYDAFGKLLKETPTGNIFPGEYVFPVDVSSLEAGIYLIKLSGVGFYQTRKLVIAK